MDILFMSEYICNSEIILQHVTGSLKTLSRSFGVQPSNHIQA